MPDYDSFEEFRDPQTYDLECDAFDSDFPVIEQWAEITGGPLLDLACGTGRMSIHMAKRGYDVTGIDIVPEMVVYGREKAARHDVTIDWVVADARAFHLKRQFPFVFMLMNAFQFLLTRNDHEAMFACVREAMLPDGYFLFETRNPNAQNLNGLRKPDGNTYTLSDGGQLKTTLEQTYNSITQIQHYQSHLDFQYADDRHIQKTLHTELRYIHPQEMEALLHYNGFQIYTVYGDWQQNPLTTTSPAMIYVCQQYNP